MALAGAAVLLVIGSALGIDDVVWRGAHAAAAVSAVSSAILDPAAIFAARSPGARGSGPLLQTKHDRVASSLRTPPVAAPPNVPEERVLAALRERPVEPDIAPASAGPPVIDTLPGIGPSAFGPETPAAFNPGPSPLSPLPAPELIAPVPPGGGPPGGGPPGGGPPPSTPTGPPTSPAPEPATWAMMMLALFAIGGALRLRRSGEKASQGASARSNA